MNPERSAEETGSLSSARADVALLISAALLIAAYVVVRYQGFWSEIDTGNAAQFIRSVAHSGLLVPGADAYPNGYGYQALAVFLIEVSGMSLHDLQVFGSQLLAVWLVLPAWMLYRELTGSRRAATLATTILLCQPEFLFGVLRGTHEKFTRGLMLLCIFLLLRSFQSRRRPVRFAALVLAFYLAIYALIAFNNLFAASFIQALLMGLVAFAVVSRWRGSVGALPPTGLWRLGNVLVTSLVLAYLFTFYAYKPAEYDLFILESTAARIFALVLDVSAKAVNPYTQWVLPAWVSLPVYLVVTLANWLLLSTSAGIWLWQGINLLRKRQGNWTESQLLLWGFYGAFASIGAVSIVADISGALVGNLQHRAFPTFAVLAAPLTASWIVQRLSSPPARRRWVYAGLAACMACLAVLSVLKATNEPVLSNKWLFYEPAESAALEWADARLPDRTVWLGFDDRLVAASMTAREGDPLSFVQDVYPTDRGTRDFLISDVNRAHSERLRQPLPTLGDDSITYDNGEVQLFHRRPRTPYQR